MTDLSAASMQKKNMSGQDIHEQEILCSGNPVGLRPGFFMLLQIKTEPMHFIIIILVLMLLVKWLEHLQEEKRQRNDQDAGGWNQKRNVSNKEAAMWNKKNVYAEGLFGDHYVDVKTFYALQFRKVPCICVIGELDTAKAFQFINEEWKEHIMTVFQHSCFDHGEQNLFFNNTIFVLHGHRMIEVGPSWCQVLHRPDQFDWSTQVIKALAAFRSEPDVKEARVIGFTCKTAMN